MAMATMKEVFPYSAMVFTIRDLKILFHLRGSHDQELVNSLIVLAKREKEERPIKAERWKDGNEAC